MKIGFVSTWFERGAAYVTKAYMNSVAERHDVFVYARGGERGGINEPSWDLPYVTWGLNLGGTKINKTHFTKWIMKNNIEVLFFNEQRDFDILAYLRVRFPTVKLGAYVDYYTEDEIDTFWFYDFLICNTRRHYSVFADHPQCFYIPWGTDIELFRPKKKLRDGVTFFHSVGMSLRKGTDLLLETFIQSGLYKESRLIVHSQLDLKKHFGYSPDDLAGYNVEVIERTVGAPGLYHLGDVYVYPTTLDGLGLTIYEALACGLPVITTDHPPMNEVITDDVGYLVEVAKFYSRSDGYYWPLAVCSADSLEEGMRYYIRNYDKLDAWKNAARKYASEQWNWAHRRKEVIDVFEKSEIIEIELDQNEFLRKRRRKALVEFRDLLFRILPDGIVHQINRWQ